MKSSLMDWLIRAWQNKHTSTSAIVLFVASVAGVIWPQYKPKTDEIARLAMFYGLVMAGDAQASKPSQAVTDQNVARQAETPKP